MKFFGLFVFKQKIFGPFQKIKWFSPFEMLGLSLTLKIASLEVSWLSFVFFHVIWRQEHKLIKLNDFLLVQRMSFIFFLFGLFHLNLAIQVVQNDISFLKLDSFLPFVVDLLLEPSDWSLELLNWK